MKIIITESHTKLLMENDLESLRDKLELQRDSLYGDNKNLIDRYLYLIKKKEEEEYRNNPKFTLSVVNKNVYPQITAKVKWPFTYKGKPSKTGYLSIIIGGQKQFPELLNTLNIYEISKQIISDKLQKHNPFEFNLN